MANPFSVHSSTNGDLTILALQGFLDAHTAPEFEKCVQREMDGGKVKLIADCRELGYISSAGLGVFVSFVEEIRAAGGDIKICGLSPKVAQVFEILGFGSIFDIVDTVDDATRHFAEPAREA